MQKICTFWFIALVLAAAAGCSDDSNTDSQNNSTSANGTTNATTGADACAEADCGELNCVVEADIARCVCPAGQSEVDGSCVVDTDCQPTTCNDRGQCSDGPEGVSCTCDEGFAGEFCETCDAAGGWVDDGNGGCTDDPCSLLDCRQDQTCEVDDLTASCVCQAGTHLEGEMCVPDETCMPGTCSGNGDCTDGDEGPTCACTEGWSGDFCAECNSALGYHPDGMGGCTTDECLPNPCSDPNRSVCDSSTGVAECSCDPGYHDEGGACVVDEVCAAGTCNNNGTCTTPGGIIDCQCDSGWTGDRCDSCDSANGYHPDGMGGCTTDPCLPNPCGDPNKTQCMTNGQSFTCACDPGYHPDGAGGCTDDPCVPDTCAANNQACRDDGTGQPECYTPTCNDGNPCTDDTLVQGVCQFVASADGTACSTTACIQNEVCSAGQCGGGTTLTCDDNNACTDDTCDDVLGCQFTNDDTNVPDDGVTCTVDSCSGGFASHVATDSLCDDAQYCTGVETCAPADASADANGCVTSNVPQPTGPSLGPCSYYSCDEASDSFVAVNRAAGQSCNDGLYCTTGDVCDAGGQCRGTLQASCPSTPGNSTCTSTHSFGNVDVTWATLDLTVTYEGGDPEVSLPWYDFYIYAVEKETGAWVRIANYDYYTSGTDKLRENVKILPGTYDILYTTATGTDFTRFNMTTAAQAVPEGIVYLQKDVTFYAGLNTYSVDVDPAAITVNVTYEGGDPEVSLPWYDFYIYAVEQDTGAWVRLANYDYYTSGTDKLRENVKLMPGTYDILYTTATGNDYTRFNMTTAAQAVPEGIVYLQKDVLVTDGSVLDIDVDPSAITVNVTYEGADPETTLPWYDFYIYAVEQDTGAWIRLANYDYYTSGTDKLRENVKLMPGTYDILYTTATGVDFTRFNMTTAPQAVAEGIVYLQKNVAVSEGSAINLDVDPAAITVDVTYEGADPETTLPWYDFYIYAVEQDTGAWVRIANYDYYTSGTDKLRENVKLMPGTYDLLYTTATGNDYSRFNMTTAPQAVPEGIVYLQKNVVVTEGSNLSVDVDPAAITVNVTYEGQNPETTLPWYDFYIYAVEQDTGAWIRLANYDYYTSGTDKLRENVKLMPGTYDILYTTATGNDFTRFNMTTAAQAVPEGIMYVQKNVVVSEGSAIALDVDPVAISPLVTVEGNDPEVTLPWYDFYIYAVERDTGAWVRIANYDYYTSGTDKLRENVKLMPGTYDILYSTATGANYTRFNMTTADQAVAEGIGYLDRCVAF